MRWRGLGHPVHQGGLLLLLLFLAGHRRVLPVLRRAVGHRAVALALEEKAGPRGGG